MRHSTYLTCIAHDPYIAAALYCIALLHHITFHYNKRHLGDIITLYTLQYIELQYRQYIIMMHGSHTLHTWFHFSTLRYITLHSIPSHHITSHNHIAILYLHVSHYIIILHYNTYHTLKIHHCRYTCHTIFTTLEIH